MTSEKEIIVRSVEETGEPNKNNTMYKFMLDKWQLYTLDDIVVYGAAYLPEELDALIDWFDSIDQRFGFDKKTVFYYYKWASRYRYVCGCDASRVANIRFIHTDIIHEGKKIHTNCLEVIYKDGINIKVPMIETIDYSLH